MINKQIFITMFKNRVSANDNKSSMNLPFYFYY